MKLAYHFILTTLIQITILLFLLLFRVQALIQGSLKFSIDHYLKSEKLLNDVVEKEFVINNEKTNLVDYWNSGKTSFFSKLNPISILRKINYQIMFISDLTENDKQKQLAKIRVLNSISYSKDLMLSHHKIVFER